MNKTLNDFLESDWNQIFNAPAVLQIYGSDEKDIIDEEMEDEDFDKILKKYENYEITEIRPTMLDTKLGEVDYSDDTGEGTIEFRLGFLITFEPLYKHTEVNENAESTN